MPQSVVPAQIWLFVGRSAGKVSSGPSVMVSSFNQRHEAAGTNSRRIPQPGWYAAGRPGIPASST